MSRRYRRRMRLAGPVRALAGIAFVGVAGAAVAGCSNHDAALAKASPSGSATATVTHGVQQIVVTTGPDLRFHPSTLVVHRGEVRIVLRNSTAAAGGPEHNLTFDGLPGATVPTIQAGQVGVRMFMAPQPGRYPFVCTIHAAQGQRGVMVVKPGPPP